MIIRHTRSLCPVCLTPVEAALVQEADGRVIMEKHCPSHGDFHTCIWQGKYDYSDWVSGVPALAEGEGLNCPANCGNGINGVLCAEHLRATCCMLLEVTGRCNLHCSFCFAHGGERADEPSQETLRQAIRHIAEDCSKPLLQLSGGEPTMREDLPELIRYAKDCGIPWVQLNTNGLRLAQDADYARTLAEAGLSFVFLQFDGVDDTVYRTLRGRPLMAEKEAAVLNAGKAGLGVTLVPTVVHGVNLDQCGAIAAWGAARSPVVRGVHYQPVSWFGRIPHFPEDSARVTLDALLHAMCTQTDLLFSDFAPSRCDHPLCGFHGSFIAREGKLIPLTRGGENREKAELSAKENCCFVGSRWMRSAAEPSTPCCCACKPDAAGFFSLRQTMAEAGLNDMDAFLKQVDDYSFTLSSMPFQDAANIDMERLRRCSLHVWRDGHVRPFCANYLTPLALQ